MNKKLVIALLILVVGGGVAYYLYKSKAAPTEADNAKAEEVAEELDDFLDGMDDIQMPTFDDSELEEEMPVDTTAEMAADTAEIAV